MEIFNLNAKFSVSQCKNILYHCVYHTSSRRASFAGEEKLLTSNLSGRVMRAT